MTSPLPPVVRSVKSPLSNRDVSVIGSPQTLIQKLNEGAKEVSEAVAEVTERELADFRTGQGDAPTYSRVTSVVEGYVLSNEDTQAGAQPTYCSQFGANVRIPSKGQASGGICGGISTRLQTQ